MPVPLPPPPSLQEQVKKRCHVSLFWFNLWLIGTFTDIVESLPRIPPSFPSHAQSSSGASVPLPWRHYSTIQCLAARRSVLHYRDGHLLDRPAVLLDCLFKCSVSNRLSLCLSDGASLAGQSRRSVIASSREVVRNGYVFFARDSSPITVPLYRVKPCWVTEPQMCLASLKFLTFQ